MRIWAERTTNGTRCPIFFARIQSAAGGAARDPDGATGRAAAQHHEAWQGRAEKFSYCARFNAFLLFRAETLNKHKYE